MKEGKALIAGAGSGGLAAAIAIAKLGFLVTVLEAEPREVYEQGHNWSDAVETKALAHAGFEIPKAQGNTFVGPLVKQGPQRKGLFEPHRIDPLYIFDPEYTCKTKEPVRFDYIIADRQVLREMQIEQAESLGVKIVFGAKVTGLIGTLDGELEDIQVRGVQAIINGTEEALEADIVIDASGAKSELRCMLGAPQINKPYSSDEYNSAYRTVRRYEGTSDSPTFCDHYRYAAYKGYFWVHFHEEGIIDIGGGVSVSSVNPAEIVKQMVASYGCISDEEIRGGSGLVHVGFPPDALVASGFAVLGDSAAQINPSNGCGVGGAIEAALKLAEVLKEAKDTSISELWDYSQYWYNGRGADYAALHAVSQPLVTLTHDEIKVLMEKNILGGEMLNYNINGRFAPSTLSSTLKALSLLFGHGDLLKKLSGANSLGGKTKAHYLTYPKTWNKEQLELWISTKPN